MIKEPLSDRIRQWLHTHIKIPVGVLIAICIFPAVSLILFYILRSKLGAMDWVSQYLTRPIRGFFSMLSSIYPIALMEIICTAAVILLIYYLIKAFRDSSRKRDKWKILGKRGLGLLVAILYVWSGWVWLWSSGYHATGFAKKNGFSNSGAATTDLIAVTEMFAAKSNELSTLVERDEAGNLIMNRSDMFALSEHIYINASEKFPSLRGSVHAPKPMYLYSWLMSITGYSGLYFSFTGESMVNIQQHAAFMPVTVAHELAHQLGVYAEDEAGFVGIFACVTSGYTQFEYAGYMSGLNHLLNALFRADADEYLRILATLTDEVNLDRSQNFAFWENSSSSNLGIDWLDRFLTSFKKTANTVTDTVYDSYLRSNNHELGLQSYGTCVNMLVEYFAPAIR